jgi:hypothetical protein
MSDDLYTLIGYQVEVIADWRRRQAEYIPGNDQNTRAASLSGSRRKSNSWKARQSTSRFASRLTA